MAAARSRRRLAGGGDVGGGVDGGRDGAAEQLDGVQRVGVSDAAKVYGQAEVGQAERLPEPADGGDAVLDAAEDRSPLADHVVVGEQLLALVGLLVAQR